MSSVVVIAPHMDDEVLGCGGVIAKHVSEGDHVSVIIVANRAYNHIYDEAVIEREKSKTRRAQEVLGFQKLIFLNLPDEQLDDKLIDVVVPIEAALHELGVPIDVAYTCHGYDSHQDHKAVFEASLIVFRPISKYKAARFYSYEVPSATDQIPPLVHRTFLANRYVDIGPFIDKKIEAMAAYEEESRVFPHPRSPEGLMVYAQKRGVEVGYHHAEAFFLLREIVD